MRICRLHLILACALLSLWVVPACADKYDDPRFPFGHLQTDPRPVTFNIGEITYRIPGNYLLSVDEKDHTIAELTAIYPSMKPYSAETQHCYQTAPAYRSSDCQVLDWLLRSSGTATSDPVVFERIRGLFRSQTPIQAPYGYELFETGPDNARINTYRKKLSPDLTILIQCDTEMNNPQHNLVCDSSVRDSARGIIKVVFDGTQFQYAADMIVKIQDFVNQHIVEKAAP